MNHACSEFNASYRLSRRSLLTAGSAGFGSVQSSSLESSNVDLTTELVNMITAQREFDSNAQVITTANQESQTVIGIDH